MNFLPRACRGVAVVALLRSTALAHPTAPLAPLAYHELAPGAIRPAGWLRTQLELMRDHSTGHLDETYPKLRDSNGWLGGTGDGWEETPYWLDGAGSPWNYGLPHAVAEDPARATTVAVHPLAPTAHGFYWNAAQAPVELTVPGRRLPDWQLAEGVAPQPVTPRDGMYKGPVAEATETLTFIPYGCTKLRVVALPVIP